MVRWNLLGIASFLTVLGLTILAALRAQAAEAPNASVLRWQIIEKSCVLLPQQNPNQDPQFFNTLGAAQVIESLNKCIFDLDDMATIDKIVAIFEAAKKLETGQFNYIKTELAKISDIKEDDRHSIELGARFMPSMTETAIQNTSCRGQVAVLFEQGASKAELLTLVHTEMAARKIPFAP
jgi:hypothetical protein